MPLVVMKNGGIAFGLYSVRGGNVPKTWHTNGVNQLQIDFVRKLFGPSLIHTNQIEKTP
jgi:hypothetical protein